MQPQTIRDPGMDPFYLVPMVQAGTGGLMPWELFSWHIFDHLVSTEHCLAYLMVASSKIRCHVTHLKHENQFTVLRWPLQSQPNRASLGCGGMGNLSVANKSAATVCC